MEHLVVLLDMDDTLIVEERSAIDAIKAAAGLAESKHGISSTELRDSVKKNARRLWHKMPTYPYCRRIGISSWEALWAKFEGDDEPLKLLRDLRDEYQTKSWYDALLDFGIDDFDLAQELREKVCIERSRRHFLFPEVSSVLDSLQQKYILGLISNGVHDLQWEKIRGTGIEHYFHHIVISGEIGVGKPDREYFSYVKSQFNIPKDRFVVVGNSLESDITGAGNAGLKSIWVNRDGKQLDHSVYYTDAVITDLIQLPETLSFVFGSI